MEKNEQKRKKFSSLQTQTNNDEKDEHRIIIFVMLLDDIENDEKLSFLSIFLSFSCDVPLLSSSMTKLSCSEKK